MDEGGVAGWGPTPPHSPALQCSNPTQQGAFPGVVQGPSSDQLCSRGGWLFGEEVKRIDQSRFQHDEYNQTKRDITPKGRHAITNVCNQQTFKIPAIKIGRLERRNR